MYYTYIHLLCYLELKAAGFSYSLRFLCQRHYTKELSGLINTSSHGAEHVGCSAPFCAGMPAHWACCIATVLRLFLVSWTLIYSLSPLFLLFHSIYPSSTPWKGCIGKNIFWGFTFPNMFYFSLTIGNCWGCLRTSRLKIIIFPQNICSITSGFVTVENVDVILCVVCFFHSTEAFRTDFSGLLLWNATVIDFAMGVSFTALDLWWTFQFGNSCPQVTGSCLVFFSLIVSALLFALFSLFEKGSEISSFYILSTKSVNI